MKRLALSAALAAAFVAMPAPAAQFERVAPYQFHYNAFRADFLDAATADAARVPRDGAHGIVNVTVLREGADATTTPIAATVSITVRNLLGDKQVVPAHRVDEATGASYLGAFEISGTDTYTFDVVVQPADGKREFPLRFTQPLTAD